jgi:hypothetical protein
MTWRTEQSIKYLCPEHEGETIEWYSKEYVDAAGRNNHAAATFDDYTWALGDWVPYAPAHVDHETHTITTAMLLEDEKHWLARHRTMPKIPVYYDVFDVPESIEAMERLTTVRVLNGRKGVQDFRADITGFDVDFSEPGWMSDEDGGDGMAHLRLVRTSPAAGEPVGLHGITMVIVWEWTAWDNDQDGVINAQDSTPYGSFSYSGGDDDFNIPGWLCPTRFC